jgi:hypothetical protein
MHSTDIEPLTLFFYTHVFFSCFEALKFQIDLSIV